MLKAKVRGIGKVSFIQDKVGPYRINLLSLAIGLCLDFLLRDNIPVLHRRLPLVKQLSKILEDFAALNCNLRTGIAAKHKINRDHFL